MTRIAEQWRTLVACCAMCALGGTTLEAQAAVSGSPRVSSVASAAVGFLTQFVTASPTVIPGSRARCPAAVCFSQFVSIKANAKWQLEVRLKVPAVGFTVDLSNPSTPSLARARVLSTVWTPVYITGSATAGLTNEATYYGARSIGRTGTLPTSIDLGLLLEYRVVQAP